MNRGIDAPAKGHGSTIPRVAATADVFQGHVCGSTAANQACVSEVFMIVGKRVLVENIPASICTHCDEAILHRNTTERVRRMLLGEAQAVRVEIIEVYTYV